MGRGFAVKQASVRAKPRTMYLETVDWATSKPSIRSSPWIRDAPHCWFSLCDAELMTEKQVLGLKQAPRLEQVSDEHPSECRIASIAGMMR